MSQTGKTFPQNLFLSHSSVIAAVVDERLKNELSRAGLQDLRGGGFLIEVVGSPLRVSGCRKDGAVVVLENL
jgi:hypothetical protein